MVAKESPLDYLRRKGREIGYDNGGDKIIEAADALSWQPIETAPKDGTKILILADYDEALGWVPSVGYWIADLGFFTCDGGDRVGGQPGDVWMHIPEPPCQDATHTDASKVGQEWR